MMKTTPRSTFEVVQPQVILGALKVLFNVPAGTTQFQTASAPGRLLPMQQLQALLLGLSLNLYRLKHWHLSLRMSTAPSSF
jgi:hypothetical protein